MLARFRYATAAKYWIRWKQVIIFASCRRLSVNLYRLTKWLHGKPCTGVSRLCTHQLDRIFWPRSSTAGTASVTFLLHYVYFNNVIALNRHFEIDARIFSKTGVSLWTHTRLLSSPNCVSIFHFALSTCQHQTRAFVLMEVTVHHRPTKAHGLDLVRQYCRSHAQLLGLIHCLNTFQYQIWGAIKHLSLAFDTSESKIIDDNTRNARVVTRRRNRPPF